MAQQVALMYAGQIVEVAAAADFFAAPQHPYARLLLQALPDSAKRGEPLAAIAGAVPPLHQRFTACRFAPRCALAEARCLQCEPALVELAGFGGARSVRCVRVAAGEIGSTVRSAEPAARQVAVDVTLRSGVATPLGAPLLSVEALTVRFPHRSGFFQRVSGANTAVDGVSFTIAAGRTLALVGESGCGKTTTGKAITQLLRHVAQIDGRAVLDGQDLFALQGQALREARRQIQLIFQDPFASLNPRLRVAEILEEGLVALRPELDAGQRHARITTLVEQVGLRADALQRWPHEFSGGQRQRIAIARALAVQPRLIVCDEPTSALDVSVQAQILNLLGELQRDTGVALLFITHNIGVVEYVAHEVAVMHRGRIIEIGAADQVLGAPRETYTRDLLAAVPRL
jgi:peptide/nickel transport system ATP-binding protein